MSQIVLSLPDNLAQEAEANGLLRSESIVALLRAEIRRRQVNRFFAAADRLADIDQPLTEAEIETEILAARKARRSSDASRS